jgi:hypothetical protein
MTHPSKTRTLTVEFPVYQGLPDQTAYYLVTKTQHSTEYLPGAYLTKAQIDDLNDNRNWAVTIVPRKSPV